MSKEVFSSAHTRTDIKIFWVRKVTLFACTSEPQRFGVFCFFLISCKAWGKLPHCRKSFQTCLLSGRHLSSVCEAKTSLAWFWLLWSIILLCSTGGDRICQMAREAPAVLSRPATCPGLSGLLTRSLKQQNTSNFSLLRRASGWISGGFVFLAAELQDAAGLLPALPAPSTAPGAKLPVLDGLQRPVSCQPESPLNVLIPCFSLIPLLKWLKVQLHLYCSLWTDWWFGPVPITGTRLHSDLMSYLLSLLMKLYFQQRTGRQSQELSNCITSCKWKIDVPAVPMLMHILSPKLQLSFSGG